MTRYDCEQGFVIFKDGAPFQAMLRLYDVRKRMLGYCENEYWLLPTDGPMPMKFAMFVYGDFIEACLTALRESV